MTTLDTWIDDRDDSDDADELVAQLAEFVEGKG